LIWISFALTRYSLVTPKRPDATCLIAEFFQSPFEAIRVFAALAGVALAADAVHRDRERLVRFLADRAVRHGAGLETLQDVLDRLDLVERHGIAAFQVQQAAQRGEVRRLLVHQPRVLLELAEVVVAHGLL
jgi:hypothetical protein